MKKKFLLLFVLPLFSQAQTNINISNYISDGTEPYIAVNPTNSNFLIAAWMKFTLNPPLSIAVAHSSDGGSTWSAPTNMVSLHPTFTHADVSIAYNAAGTAYICYIDYDPSQDSGYIMVASSVNNGATWNTPVKVTSGLESNDRPIDRPWIAIDKSGGPNNGKIYIVSKSISSGQLPHHIWMKTSSDGGLTWTPRQQVDFPSTVGQITNSMGSIDVGPEGNVYIAYMSWDNTQYAFPRVILNKSTNGGNTFTSYVIGYPVAGSSITDTLYQGSYCVKANPSNGNNLVFIFTDARYGDPDILSVYSTDGGVTWSSSPVRVNDDLPQGNGYGQEMCWGGFSPNGNYFTVWRDRRNGGTTSSSDFEMYVAVSTDGGLSFKPNYKISSLASKVIPLAKGNDFIGVAVDNNFLYTDWSDQRPPLTKPEIYTARDSVHALVSVQELKNSPLSMTINAFPNPFSSDITFVINCQNETSGVSVSVYDMNGKEISKVFQGKLNRSENKFTFSGNKIANGNYILKVQSSSGSSQKIFTKAGSR